MYLHSSCCAIAILIKSIWHEEKANISGWKRKTSEFLIWKTNQGRRRRSRVKVAEWRARNFWLIFFFFFKFHSLVYTSAPFIINIIFWLCARCVHAVCVSTVHHEVYLWLVLYIECCIAAAAHTCVRYENNEVRRVVKTTTVKRKKRIVRDGRFPFSDRWSRIFFFLPLYNAAAAAAAHKSFEEYLFRPFFFLCRAIILFRVFNGECLNVPFSQNNGL